MEKIMMFWNEVFKRNIAYKGIVVISIEELSNICNGLLLEYNDFMKLKDTKLSKLNDKQ